MKSETLLVNSAVERLRDLLPADWACGLSAPRDSTDRWRLTLQAPDGVAADLAVEPRWRLSPGAVVSLGRAPERQGSLVPLVAAGWLSPLSRAALTSAGLNYLDLTGNVDLRLSRPGLCLRASGAAHDPEPAPSALQSLKGAGAGRAVQALVDFVPPYGVRQLAQASGATAPVLSRVLGLLEREALVVRDAAGTVVTVAWANVLRRWAEDYAFPRAHRVVPCLDPRGVAAFVRKVSGLSSAWAATGTLGVPPGVAVAPVQLAAIYVPSPEQAAADLGLTPVASGANVLLVEPADPGVYARSTPGKDGVVRCAPSRVVVDLLTGPGRGTSEAEALLGWMQAQEDVWRSRL